MKCCEVLKRERERESPLPSLQDLGISVFDKKKKRYFFAKEKRRRKKPVLFREEKGEGREKNSLCVHIGANLSPSPRRICKKED